MSILEGNAVVFTQGGPTAVINASWVGVALGLMDSPEITGNMRGITTAAKIKKEEVKVCLRFADAVSDLRDERAQKNLGQGDAFEFLWKMNEAIVVSFAGSPPID